MEEADYSLLHLAKAGDRSAFSQLVERWYSRVHAVSQSRLSHCVDADDATQEVFVRCYLGLNELRDDSRFPGWLRGIANHICMDFQRSRYREKRLKESMEWMERTNVVQEVSAELERVEERQEVLSAIATLPESHREVVLLHYYSNMTYDQMAEWLQVARATIQDRLAQSRSRLRTHLLQRWRISHDL